MSINPLENNLARQLISREGPFTRRDRITKEFFEGLLAVKPIGSIYYPGVGMDFILDDIFPPSRRYYLDDKPTRRDIVLGKYDNTPNILDGTFDAVFLRDTHAPRRAISEILRTVKQQGTIILSTWLCGEESRETMPLAEILNLRTLEILPTLSSNDFKVLQKK